jgi:hypothetical protein
LSFSDLEDAPDFAQDPVNPDIPYSGHEGQLVVIADDGTSITFDQPRYDIICFFEGTIPNGQLVLRFPFSRRVYFPAGMIGSVASLGVAATAETVLSLKKDLVEFATITFAAAGTSGVITSPSDIRFEIGDVLTVHGPAGADATAADLGFTLNGERRLTG